ncbi:ACT domain-containing protein [Nocardiopsis suaedae]|uniref:ACT domain-containing protein n=1 Tax=Nocardiopsis suaedae TaxID=3018444 RepID=A0ABT4TTH1_9ACTN|nr:hypothetical protein [Nocardiopsis suaedae]MDA2807937.1 hypothetical protein [Nocardiopsis suaedae]
MDAVETAHAPDPDRTPYGARGGTPHGLFGFMGREALELGALLLAGGAAHLLVLSLGHSEGGGALLIALGAALVAGASMHRWLRHRRQARAGRARRGRAAPGTGARPPGERLWRLRVAVDDLPGGLAALTGRMAELGADIRLVQVHPGAGEALDDFFLTAPGPVGPERLRAAVARAGGHAPVVEPADVRDLRDTTGRALSLVAAVAGGVPLAEALADLCGADGAEHVAAPPEGTAPDEPAGTALCLSVPGGGHILLRRERVPFTAVEFARCQAFIGAAAAMSRPAAPLGAA